MRADIKNIFIDMGITQVGVCDFAPFANRLFPVRNSVRLPECAGSVIVCLFPYKVQSAPPENLSRYAAVPDYHGIVMRYLETAAAKLSEKFTDYSFVPFTDNSPLPEVDAAVSARLGVKGKNGLLINQVYGSFVFIGEIVTDMPIDALPPITAECINCGMCLKFCPVGCEKERCLSALSQKKGRLSEKEAAILCENKILWGCDICAEVCPMNKGKKTTDIPEFIEGYRNSYSPGEDPQGRAYMWRGTAPIKRNFDLINGG